jgi:hypothetical protein
LAAVTTLIGCNLPITPYLYHILTDGEFRSACLQQVSDPLIHLTFKNYYEKLGRDQAQAAGSTLRRAFLISYSPVIRNALGQPDNWLDFRTIMNAGKSIIISLGGLEDETKRLIGAMLMVAIEQAALSRTDISERRPFRLLVDEWGPLPHRSERLPPFSPNAENLPCSCIWQHRVWHRYQAPGSPARWRTASSRSPLPWAEPRQKFRQSNLALLTPLPSKKNPTRKRSTASI